MNLSIYKNFKYFTGVFTGASFAYFSKPSNRENDFVNI